MEDFLQVMSPSHFQNPCPTLKIFLTGFISCPLVKSLTDFILFQQSTWDYRTVSL